MIEVETTLADADNGYVLEDQIGYLLRRAHQRASAIFQEIMTEGLTPPQFAALVKIRDFGTVSQNRLGRSVAMDPATSPPAALPQVLFNEPGHVVGDRPEICLSAGLEPPDLPLRQLRGYAETDLLGLGAKPLSRALRGYGCGESSLGAA